MTTLNALTPTIQVKSQVELLSPTVDTAFLLPSAANLVGKIFTFVNSGTAKILVQASNGSLVRTVYPSTTGQVTPNTDAPTTSAQWEGIGSVESLWAAFTPIISTGITLGNGTVTGMWRRKTENLEVQIALTTGSTSAWTTTPLQWDLSNLVSSFDFNKFAAANLNNVGIITGSTEAGVSYTGTMRTSTSASGPLILSYGGAGATDNWDFKTATRPATFTTTAAGQAIRILVTTLPITGWSATKG